MKIVLIGIMFIFMSGCVSRSINKVSGIITNTEICVVRNHSVSLDFFNAYSNTLENNGYVTREVEHPNECPVYTTYTAQFGNHWGLYLARASFIIYKDGVPVGSATYKAPRFDITKHGRIEAKIQTLVNKMFENNR